jgi:hypothetical protein
MENRFTVIPNSIMDSIKINFTVQIILDFYLSKAINIFHYRHYNFK